MTPEDFNGIAGVWQILLGAHHLSCEHPMPEKLAVHLEQLLFPFGLECI